MKIQLTIILFLSLVFTACEFTETLVIMPDGSGTVELDTNLDQMMSMMEGMDEETTIGKSNRTIRIKDFLTKNADSINKLPADKQKRLKKIENFQIQEISDPEQSKLRQIVKLKFKNISEVNNLLIAAEEAQNILSPGAENETEDVDVIEIKYEFVKNRFKRSGIIKDPKAHKAQLDSLKATEGFFSTSVYKLNYTFPKEIKSVSLTHSKIVNNKRTLEVEVPFLEYYKNPSILDLEVLLSE